jgi:hypothetical protein
MLHRLRRGTAVENGPSIKQSSAITTRNRGAYPLVAELVSQLLLRWNSTRSFTA